MNSDWLMKQPSYLDLEDRKYKGSANRHCSYFETSHTPSVWLTCKSTAWESQKFINKMKQSIVSCTRSKFRKILNRQFAEPFKAALSIATTKTKVLAGAHLGRHLLSFFCHFFLDGNWFDYLLRGCLSKNHPLNFAWKIILPETLATERLYQG